MIILRQKEYSSPATKILFRTKQAKSAVDTGLMKANQKIKKLFLKPNTVASFVNERPVIKPSRQSIMRDTIKRKNAIKGGLKEKAINTTKKAEDAVNYLKTHTPGNMAADGVGRFVESPIASTATVATFPITGGILEGAAKRSSGYRHATEYLGKKYKSSKAPSVVSGVVDGVVTSLKPFTG